MSAERFTDNDYELLSAYIDGMLDAAARSALETRLEQEPALRQELAALRQTVALVNNLPPVKAPRDFTLSRDMIATSGAAAGTPPPRKVLRFPVLTALSTAAATVLMVAGLLLMLVGGEPDSDTVAMSEQMMGVAPTVENGDRGALPADEVRIAPSPEPPASDESAGAAPAGDAAPPPAAALEMEEAAEMPVPEVAPEEGDSEAAMDDDADTFSAEAAEAPSRLPPPTMVASGSGDGGGTFPEAEAPQAPPGAGAIDQPETAEQTTTTETAVSTQETGELLVVIGAVMLGLIGLANLIVQAIRRRRT